jgi:hypothetical protein
MDTTNRVSLVQAHCLRQMAPGDALLILATLPPAFITTRRWFDDRALRSRAETPTPARLLRAGRPGNDRSDEDPAGRSAALVDDVGTSGIATEVEAALQRLEMLAAPQQVGRAPEDDT